MGGEGGCGRQQRLVTVAVGTGQGFNAGTKTAKKAGKDRDKAMIEVSNLTM